jgi:hypothetical protein
VGLAVVVQTPTTKGMMALEASNVGHRQGQPLHHSIFEIQQKEEKKKV